MADASTRFTPILTPRQRRQPVELPQEPTDEELARDWALSAEDREEARRCRGDPSRLRFAVQLCVVRRHGRFLEGYAGVPARILNFLSRQLELPPVLALEASPREGTQQEHQRRIREYLRLQTFDLPIQERLERWVWGRAAEGLSAAEIFPQAEETLRLWRVLLPARSTLERLVASQTARAQEDIFQRLSARLSPECRADLDGLLEVGAVLAVNAEQDVGANRAVGGCEFIRYRLEDHARVGERGNRDLHLHDVGCIEGQVRIRIGQGDKTLAINFECDRLRRTAQDLWSSILLRDEQDCERQGGRNRYAPRQAP